ncbi:MAG: transcription antitermination factor NusB [Clostridia bacterium]|nr:transcription antitermination factor NusB [Clostridia bacterium]
MTRHEEREQAFALLYEYTFYPEISPSEFISSREDLAESQYGEFAKECFAGVNENLDAIDNLIAEHSVGWKVKRMSRITKSVLRLAVYELLYSETPPKAAINEAVELSKAYDEAKASGFVNGILNKIARDAGKISDNGQNNE